MDRVGIVLVQDVLVVVGYKYRKCRLIEPIPPTTIYTLGEYYFYSRGDTGEYRVVPVWSSYQQGMVLGIAGRNLLYYTQYIPQGRPYDWRVHTLVTVSIYTCIVWVTPVYRCKDGFYRQSIGLQVVYSSIVGLGYVSTSIPIPTYLPLLPIPSYWYSYYRGWATSGTLGYIGQVLGIDRVRDTSRQQYRAREAVIPCTYYP